MSQYRIVHSAVHAAIAGLCWWVLTHINELQAYIAMNREVAVPVVLAALALLFRLSDALSNALVEKVPIVSRALRRLICGQDFIEGDWPLVVVDMEKQELLYLGFLRIAFKKAQIHVRGDDFKPTGEHAHAFQSVQSLYRDQTLQYWYEQGASLHKPDMRGFTQIYFFPQGEFAERHAGKFLDARHTSDIRFYAVRHKYKPLESRLRSTDEKLEAARALWAEIAPKLDKLKARDIGLDFA